MASLILKAASAEPTRIPLSGDLLLVGRDREAPIRLNHASVSRFHARFVRQGSAPWTLEDLGSSNGSFVNGVRISAETPLSSGDRLRFGTIEALFEDGARTARAAPAEVPTAAPAEIAVAARPRRTSGRGILALVVTALITSAIWVGILAVIGKQGDGEPEEPDPPTRVTTATEGGGAHDEPAMPPTPRTESRPEAPRVPPRPTPARAPPAHEVLLRSGHRYQGDFVPGEDPLHRSFRDVSGTVLEIPVEEIAAIDGEPFVPDLNRVFAARRARADRTRDLVELAAWCEEHGLDVQRDDVARAVLDRDPGNVVARRILGHHRYRGRWLTPEELTAQSLIGPSGELEGSDRDRREIRRLHIALFGRSPTEEELLDALSYRWEDYVQNVLSTAAFHRGWCQRRGSALGLPMEIFNAGGALAELPDRLLSGETTTQDALREMVSSPSFVNFFDDDAGYASRLLEELLGFAGEKDPRLFQACVRMCAGERVAIFGERGSSREDFVGIVLSQPRFYQALLLAESRDIGSPLDPGAARRLALSLAARPDKLGELRREWLLAEEWSRSCTQPRRRSAAQVAASFHIDFMGREATAAELAALGAALSGEVDLPAALTWLARSLIPQREPEPPWVRDLPPAQWVRRTFLRTLGRLPAETEARLFTEMLESARCSRTAILVALASSGHYLVY